MLHGRIGRHVVSNRSQQHPKLESAVVTHVGAHAHVGSPHSRPLQRLRHGQVPVLGGGVVRGEALLRLGVLVGACSQ